LDLLDKDAGGVRVVADIRFRFLVVGSAALRLASHRLMFTRVSSCSVAA
jgi:hypothetical protein